MGLRGAWKQGERKSGPAWTLDRRRGASLPERETKLSKRQVGGSVSVSESKQTSLDQDQAVTRLHPSSLTNNRVACALLWFLSSRMPDPLPAGLLPFPWLRTRQLRGPGSFAPHLKPPVAPGPLQVPPPLQAGPPLSVSPGQLLLILSVLTSQSSRFIGGVFLPPQTRLSPSGECPVCPLLLHS